MKRFKLVSSIILVILFIILQLFVIQPYSLQKTEQIKEMKQRASNIELIEKGMQEIDFNFISKLMIHMVQNKDTLYISDDFQIENKPELVEQFLSNYEMDYLEAHQLVSNLIGTISFVEKMTEVGLEPQARFWNYVRKREEIIVKLEGTDEEVAKLLDRQLFDVTFTYNEESKQIEEIIRIGQGGNYYLNNGYSNILIHQTQLGKNSLTNLPNHTLKIRFDRSLYPVFNVNSEMKDIPIQPIKYKMDTIVSYR